MNIFVAKLSSVTKAEDLQELFSKFGEVISAKVIMDRDSELDGSQIIVKKSEPKAEKKPFRPRRDFRDRDHEPKY